MTPVPARFQSVLSVAGSNHAEHATELENGLAHCTILHFARGPGSLRTVQQRHRLFRRNAPLQADAVGEPHTGAKGLRPLGVGRATATAHAPTGGPRWQGQARAEDSEGVQPVGQCDRPHALLQAVDEHEFVWVFKVANLRTQALQELREDWKDSRFVFGKNRVCQIALGRSEAEEHAENLHLVRYAP
jgi:hypothetical protein